MITLTLPDGATREFDAPLDGAGLRQVDIKFTGEKARWL